MNNLNIYNIIIVLGIIHGLIFGSILIINKKLKSRTNFYLSLTVFALAFSNLQYWLKDVNLYPSLKYLPFIPFEFLMLPFFYFFVKSFLDREISRYEKIILLSFFPFFIIYQYIFIEAFFSLKLIDLLNLVIEYVSLIYSIALIFITFKIIINYEKEYSNNKKLRISTKWLKHILIIGLILCVIWFLSLNLFENIITAKGYYQFYPLWIGISILIYWIGYASIFQTNIFNQRQSIRIKNRESNQKQINKTGSKTFNTIEDRILNGNLYLNSNLKLSILANELNLSEGYVSQLFKDHSKLSFNDYINTLRVDEAKRMLNDVTYRNYTIIAIGLESGFNSKSSFYSVFKKITLKTPNEYKKEVQNS